MIDYPEYTQVIELPVGRRPVSGRTELWPDRHRTWWKCCQRVPDVLAVVVVVMLLLYLVVG